MVKGLIDFPGTGQRFYHAITSLQSFAMELCCIHIQFLRSQLAIIQLLGQPNREVRQVLQLFIQGLNLMILAVSRVNMITLTLTNTSKTEIANQMPR
jgi:hypothetical protein